MKNRPKALMSYPRSEVNPLAHAKLLAAIDASMFAESTTEIGEVLERIVSMDDPYRPGADRAARRRWECLVAMATPSDGETYPALAARLRDEQRLAEFAQLMRALRDDLRELADRRR